MAKLGVYLPVHDRTLVLLVSATKPYEPPEWVDASSLLLARAGSLQGDLNLQFGVDRETGAMRPATLKFWLDNTNRQFDTRNTSSPWVALLKPRRRVWLRTYDGRPGEALPGADYVDDVYDDIYDDIYSGRPIDTLFDGFLQGFPRSRSMHNQFGFVTFTATDGTRIVAGSGVDDGDFVLDDDEYGPLDTGGFLGFTEGDTAVNEMMSGDLMNRVLDAVKWPADRRDIAPGRIRVGYNRLAEQATGTIKDAVVAEYGATYFSTTGNFTFLDRLFPWTLDRSANVQAVFGPAGGEALWGGVPVTFDGELIVYGVAGLPYQGIDNAGPRDDNIKNKVSRTGLTGNEQVRQDDESIEDYGRLRDADEVITVKDVDVRTVVDVELAMYAGPIESIDGFVLNALENRALYAETIHRQPFDRIAVVDDPPGGDPFPAVECFLQSKELTIGKGTWQATYRLAPAPTEALFTLNDDEDGELSGPTVLAP